VVGSTLDLIWPSLKKASLKPVSIHFDTARFTPEQDKLPGAFEDAAKRGFVYKPFQLEEGSRLRNYSAHDPDFQRALQLHRLGFASTG